METKRRGGRSGKGLRATAEDMQWLRLLEINSATPVPPFNVSRLVALGYITRKGGNIFISDKGNIALKAH